METVETKAHEKGHLLPLVRSSTPWHGWLPIWVWQQDVPPHLQVVGWWPSTDPKVATCRCGPASCSCPEWECWLFWNDGRCYGRVSFWSFWLHQVYLLDRRHGSVSKWGGGMFSRIRNTGSCQVLEPVRLFKSSSAKSRQVNVCWWLSDLSECLCKLMQEESSKLSTVLMQ